MFNRGKCFTFPFNTFDLFKSLSFFSLNYTSPLLLIPLSLSLFLITKNVTISFLLKILLIVHTWILGVLVEALRPSVN